MKKVIIAFIVLTGVFAIYSCSVNDETNKDSNELMNDTPISYVLKEGESPYYKQNKWDTCGVMHNNILKAVVANKINLGKVTNDYIDYSNNQFHEIYDPNYTITTLTTEQVRTVMADSTNYYVNVIDNNIHYTTTVKTSLSEFFMIIANSSTEENLTYSIMKNKIIRYEDNIIASNISETDKDEILKVTSVARHSLYFWNKELGDLTEISITGKRPIWKWIVVGLADVAGGAAGATAGSLTGVLAVAGGVAGAAGASSGASSLVDWISPDQP